MNIDVQRGMVITQLATPLTVSEAGSFLGDNQLLVPWVYTGTRWIEVASVEGWALMCELIPEWPTSSPDAP